MVFCSLTLRLVGGLLNNSGSGFSGFSSFAASSCVVAASSCVVAASSFFNNFGYFCLGGLFSSFGLAATTSNHAKSSDYSERIDKFLHFRKD